MEVGCFIHQLAEKEFIAENMQGFYHLLFFTRAALHWCAIRPLGVGQLAKIQRFVQFCIFVYVPWWMACPVASAAPRNDMLLWNSCRQYVEVDSACASAATKALSRHLWYLSEELVLLSLFDDGVTEQEKEQIKHKFKLQPKEVL